MHACMHTYIHTYIHILNNCTIIHDLMCHLIICILWERLNVTMFVHHTSVLSNITHSFLQKICSQYLRMGTPLCVAGEAQVKAEMREVCNSILPLSPYRLACTPSGMERDECNMQGVVTLCDGGHKRKADKWLMDVLVPYNQPHVCHWIQMTPSISFGHLIIVALMIL